MLSLHPVSLLAAPSQWKLELVIGNSTSKSHRSKARHCSVTHVYASTAAQPMRAHVFQPRQSCNQQSFPLHVRASWRFQHRANSLIPSRYPIRERASYPTITEDNERQKETFMLTSTILQVVPHAQWNLEAGRPARWSGRQLFRGRACCFDVVSASG